MSTGDTLKYKETERLKTERSTDTFLGIHKTVFSGFNVIKLDVSNERIAEHLTSGNGIAYY